MKTKELNIEAPEGYAIDQDNSDLSKGIIKFKKCEVDTRWCSWEGLESVGGYCVDEVCSINYLSHCSSFDYTYKSTFVTKAQAEASTALAQLTQLVKHVNGDWEPDWGSLCSKYSILLSNSNICVVLQRWTPQTLTFRTEVDAEKFLETHKDLIKKAAPLLWGVEL